MRFHPNHCPYYYEKDRKRIKNAALALKNLQFSDGLLLTILSMHKIKDLWEFARNCLKNYQYDFVLKIYPHLDYFYKTNLIAEPRRNHWMDSRSLSFLLSAYEIVRHNRIDNGARSAIPYALGVCATPENYQTIQDAGITLNWKHVIEGNNVKLAEIINLEINRKTVERCKNYGSYDILNWMYQKNPMELANAFDKRNDKGNPILEEYETFTDLKLVAFLLTHYEYSDEEKAKFRNELDAKYGYFDWAKEFIATYLS